MAAALQTISDNRASLLVEFASGSESLHHTRILFGIFEK